MVNTPAKPLTFFSLTPCFSRVWRQRKVAGTVSTVSSLRSKPVETVFNANDHTITPLKRGVNEKIFISFATFAAVLCCTQLSAKELADYHVGDKLEADIVAPERMTVINPEATATLKEKGEQSVPVICRYYPGVVDEAEAALHAAFKSARDSFLASVEAAFNQRTLDAQTTATTEFQRLVGAFQSRNTGFPLNTDLAGRWARGESDGGIEDSLAARLRGSLKRPTRPYGMPDGLKLTYTVRLISLSSNETTATPEVIEQNGRNVTRTNLITLPWARSKLQGSFDENEQAWGKFTAGFVKENCFPDVQLTRQARAKKVEQLQIADTYEKGQTIARRGDIVESKIMAAVGELIRQTATSQLQQSLVVNQAQTAIVKERNSWLFVVLGGVSLGAIFVIWILRRRPATLLPARIGSGEGDATVVPHSEMRARVAPHLARLMMDKLFQGMISQRKQMIATQEKAADDVAELEAHLEKVRAPLEERLRAYEQRITELEKELSVRGEENQELLKAKIFMVKKQMETTRAKGKLELN